MTFQLDTTGIVLARAEGLKDQHPHAGRNVVWTDLDAFTQGYVEALFEVQNGYIALIAGFSDLAPETLARIIADCAEFATFANKLGQKEVTAFVPTYHWGATFWNYRQAERWLSAFPPLTVQLGDDGKVRFAA